MQMIGLAQETETAPEPIGWPAVGTGPVQLVPSKWYARPMSSRATQEVGPPQDTAANPVP